jgi:hypothetical protein
MTAKTSYNYRLGGLITADGQSHRDKKPLKIKHHRVSSDFRFCL